MMEQRDGYHPRTHTYACTGTCYGGKGLLALPSLRKGNRHHFMKLAMDARNLSTSLM